MAVPMTLTAIDGELLDSLQYRRMDDILRLSPGVMTYPGGDGVSSRISIRGVVSPGLFVEPGNAVYVDEIYASGMLSVWPAFYDIDSVQVLKGPQAGLYGRNTMGGAVLISTAQPTDEQQARINASYAQYNQREVDAMVNVPLSDQARLRAVGWYRDKNGGYFESGLNGDNLDTFNEHGGRLTLAVLPDERTNFSLTGAFDDRSGPTLFNGVVEGARFGPAPLPTESRRDVLRDDLARQETDQVSFNSRLALDTDAGSLIAVAGWRQIELQVPTYDDDGTAFEASYADYLADPVTKVSELPVHSPRALTGRFRDSLLNAEVRFLTPDTGGPVKSQVGVSYFEENARFFTQTSPLRDFALILADMGCYGTDTQRTRQDTNAWAGFGELIWTPRDAVEITAELRYTREQKNFDYAKSLTGYYSIGALVPTVDTEPKRSFTNWSPGITLAYRPADTLTYYVKYVRGFHAGGFNNQVNDPALLAYESEKSENYELGGKAQLFDQRLNVGASIFYLRIDNALLPTFDGGPGLPSYNPLQNVVLAETTGIELDLELQATAGLTFTASAGAYDSEVSEEGWPAFGNRAFVPDYTASLVADYQRPLSASITGTATLGYRHRSGGRVPSIFEVEMDSFNLLDAQVGVIVGNVLVAGFVQNALDDNYIVSNYDTIGQSQYIKASGLNPLTTRAIVRDPGTVFGVRATVTF
jgi:iron complex outermembrane receptor protein